jgi:hypothetical protein
VIANFGYFTGVIQDIVGVAVIVLGAAAAIFVYARYKPRFVLTIEPRWTDNLRLLTLGLRVENNSPVRSGRPEVRLQVLTPSVPPAGQVLPEYLPFEQEEWNERGYGAAWLDPVAILEPTTDKLYPGEVLAVERPMNCDDLGSETVLHVGLQIRLPQSRFTRWLRRGRGTYSLSQTTTCFVVKPQAKTPENRLASR